MIKYVHHWKCRHPGLKWRVQSSSFLMADLTHRHPCPAPFCWTRVPTAKPPTWHQRGWHGNVADLYQSTTHRRRAKHGHLIRSRPTHCIHQISVHAFLFAMQVLLYLFIKHPIPLWQQRHQTLALVLSLGRSINSQRL